LVVGSNVDSISFTPDGKFLASLSLWVSKPSIIRFWSVTSGNCIETIKTVCTGGRCSNIEYTPDNRMLLITAPSVICLQAMDTNTLEELQEEHAYLIKKMNIEELQQVLTERNIIFDSESTNVGDLVHHLVIHLDRKQRKQIIMRKKMDSF
jgi:WD40 repeat protein